MKLLPIIGLSLIAFCCNSSAQQQPQCTCDIPAFVAALPPASPQLEFHKLDAEKNKQLWFDEITHANSTRYTPLWDDYHENNFHASHSEFKKQFQQSTNIKLAFQAGPAGPLWTYYTFVLKEENCCLVLIRTSFAHARFVYKAYSLLSPQQADSLFNYVRALERTEVDDSTYYFSASFVDNTNGDVFDVALDRRSSRRDEKPLPSAIDELFNFVDNRIKWKETYPLDKK